MGALTPFRVHAFCWLWVAALSSNIGTWMHEVGAGWLMKDLSGGSRVMVALAQAATTLPFFLLSIPAGALADVVDRRRLILVCQLASLALAAALAFATWQHRTTPATLVLFTLALGTLAALANPAWQTVMTDLVPSDQLAHAAALNNVSTNLARAIGPTLGGLLVASQGPHAAFALNAVSFVGISFVLWRWKHRPPNRAALAERFLGAIRSGVRYVRYHPPMRAVLWRTVSFVPPAACLWALMPVTAAEHVRLGASGYGIMMGCLGLGAVAAAFVLPPLRRTVGPNAIVVGATLAYGGAMALLALQPVPAFAFASMTICGAGWLTMVTSLNGSAQACAPPWVRARALACYLSAFYASWSVGSLAWGAIAQSVGIRDTLLIASACEAIGLLTLLRYRLSGAVAEDAIPSRHWEDPVASHDIDPDDGPVVITIEYRIEPEDAEAFRAAMGPVAQTRYRDGAFSWTLSRDTEDPRRWLEVFFVESWAEHLRQHDRVTLADQRVQDHAKSFHRPRADEPERPVVGHFIAAQPAGTR